MFYYFFGRANRRRINIISTTKGGGTFPPNVLAFLAECKYPLSEAEIHMIEKKMDRVHNLAAPHQIGMSQRMQQLGVPYEVLSQLASEGLLTGCSYYHSIE